VRVEWLAVPDRVQVGDRGAEDGALAEDRPAVAGVDPLDGGPAQGAPELAPAVRGHDQVARRLEHEDAAGLVLAGIGERVHSAHCLAVRLAEAPGALLEAPE